MLIANSLVCGCDAQVLARQQEAAGVAVEGEFVHACADGDHELGLRAVDRVAGADLPCAGLEENVLLGRGALRRQHRKNRADGHVHVDIARPVERVEQQQVVAARVRHRNAHRLVHLLGGHGRQSAAPFVGLDQHLVGDDVEFLLGFALDVGRGGAAQHAAQCAATHRVGNRFDRARHRFQQQAQVRVHAVVALATDQKVR
jgi:hypothetical protein